MTNETVKALGRATKDAYENNPSKFNSPEFWEFIATAVITAYTKYETKPFVSSLDLERQLQAFKALALQRKGEIESLNAELKKMKEEMEGVHTAEINARISKAAVDNFVYEQGAPCANCQHTIIDATHAMQVNQNGEMTKTKNNGRAFLHPSLSSDVNRKVCAACYKQYVK